MIPSPNRYFASAFANGVTPGETIYPLSIVPVTAGSRTNLLRWGVSCETVGASADDPVFIARLVRATRVAGTATGVTKLYAYNPTGDTTAEVEGLHTSPETIEEHYVSIGTGLDRGYPIGARPQVSTTTQCLAIGIDTTGQTQSSRDYYVTMVWLES